MPAVLRHNLPAEPNRFIGRYRDTDEVCALFGESRLLTLCGLGGIGKSRFALHAAERLIDEHPDGVWLVELAEVTRPELAIHEIVRVLGVHEEAGRPLLDVVGDFLRPRRVLLLLDNCEHLIDRVAEVVATLLASCPSLRVLATSREPLKIAGELVWRVPALRLPDDDVFDDVDRFESVQLFMDRSQAAGSGLRLTTFNSAAVAGLCRALDGIPLALELAAARTTVLSPEQIASRIADRFDLLRSRDRTAPERQRTLIATVEWSHDLLPAREKTLLRRLSVFVGPFDLDLAEAVCSDAQVPREEILDLLTGLVDKSLLACDRPESGRMRYRLLETIRQYADARLTEAAEQRRFRDRQLQAVCERITEHYQVGMAAARTPWQRRVAEYQGVVEQFANIRAALHHAAAIGDAAAGMRMACAMVVIWVSRGMWQEGRDWYERLLALDHTSAPPELVGQTWAWHAEMLYGQDKLGEMLESAERGLALQRQGEPGFELGLTLSLVGATYIRLGDYERGLPLLQEQLDNARKADEPWNIGMALTGLAGAALGQGRLRESQRLSEEALAAYQDSNHGWGIASGANELARLAEARGDVDAAAAYYEISLPVLRELGAIPLLARALAGLGRVAGQRQEFARARELLGESLRLSQSTGQQLAVSRGLAAWASLAEAEGDLARAVVLSGAATVLRESYGWPEQSSRVERLLTLARVRLGESRTDLLWSQGRRMSAGEAARHAEGASPPPEARPVPVERASVLTAREREIVDLIVRGLSNKAIGDELVISPATAARHVANILTKLGFTSRTQIAAWASREHT